MNRLLNVTLAAIAIALVGCRPAVNSSPSDHANFQSNNRSNEMRRPAAAPSLDPCALILAPHSGDTTLDREIIRLQQVIPHARDPVPLLERLGWTFISKARATFDPAFYNRAEQCAQCLDAKRPGSAEALLLRGHVFQNLHRFKEAEPLARQLVVRRGLPYDFALLGDMLMEQGDLKGAVAAYQRMVDLRPDPQAYTRIAHIRWLKGDLDGARDLMTEAAHSASPLDAESGAWMNTRLALYEFQAGHNAAAWQSCAKALEWQSNYPPALLLRGRMLLAEGQMEEALESLVPAAAANPLPEYQWTLADALRAANRAEEAAKVEAQLARSGVGEDPRTFALFLATRRENPSVARALAEHELTQRADVQTHDALAWALAACEQWDDAARESALALAEGTVDARILFHAGIIAAKRSRKDEARRLLEKAEGIQQMLLPSERERLEMALHQTALTQ
jgi:tetratricopeptide (TPR) repeat protein